jgi:hypothetical protein
MNISLALATVISWACTNNALRQSQDSNVEYFEGFLHAQTLIRLGSLRRVLPEKQTTDAGEIVEVTFEEVDPGPGKDYMYHPTIKTFLEETSLDPLASDKRMLVRWFATSLPSRVAMATGADSQGFVPNLLLKGFFCSASCPTSITITLKLQFKLALLPNPVQVFLSLPGRESPVSFFLTNKAPLITGKGRKHSAAQQLF